MVEAFAARGLPLWVAYYRRALPRFLLVRDLLADGAIGQVTSVHVEVARRSPAGAARPAGASTRRSPARGLFFDLASHCFDLLDFLLGPVTDVCRARGEHRRRLRCGGRDRGRVRAGGRVLGTGVWNFNASRQVDRITFSGSAGELVTPIFSDTDVVVRDADGETRPRGAQPAARPPAADPGDRRRAPRRSGRRHRPA